VPCGRTAIPSSNNSANVDASKPGVSLTFAASCGLPGSVRGVETARASARARILDAAIKLIARDGIHDVRIARVAMEAGVSASLLHYHFASRDALLAEALEHSYELAGASRMGGDHPVASRLREMIDQCLPLDGALRDDWLLWVELWLHAARRPELRATAAKLYARMHAWFMEAITEGIESGELTVDDPERVTDRLLALIDGYGIRALSEDPAMPVERAREEIWAAVAPALGLGRAS
jgi:AcrR family transcriptional regulator